MRWSRMTSGAPAGGPDQDPSTKAVHVAGGGKDPTTNTIIEVARGYLGIPFVHGGRTARGLDCLGLIHLFYGEFGIDVPSGDGKPYSPDWSEEDPGRYLRGILSFGEDCPIDDLHPLDLVYFRIGQNIEHAGVMISRTHFIHVLKGLGVTISPLASRWGRRLAGARRIGGRGR